ncbi:MAG: bifunctional adenosylcobinamide kinase/adenosylcobinamide-phosphate guanylyltransferase [Oscillospiraceae bacterium]
MILIVGGAYSGKREFAKSLGYAETEMADAVLDDKPVLYNLQDLVAAAPERAPLLVDALVKKNVVICNEVGSGIIPVDTNERAAREATGRLCILLAQKAEKVVRIVCGIPAVIKE